MDRNELVSVLTDIFRRIFNNSSLSVTPDLTANDVEGWDSLTHMLLVSEIENTFNIKLKLKDLNKMKNVGDMIEIINSKF